MSAVARRKAIVQAAFVAPIILALGTFLGATGAFIVSIRTSAQTAELAAGQEAIHVLVNSRLTEALEKIAALEEFISKLTGNPDDAQRAEKANIEAGGAASPKKEIR